MSKEEYYNVWNLKHNRWVKGNPSAKGDQSPNNDKDYNIHKLTNPEAEQFLLVFYYNMGIREVRKIPRCRLGECKK